MTERTLAVRENTQLKGQKLSLFTNIVFVTQICMKGKKESFVKRTNALPFITSGTFLRERLLIKSGGRSGLVRSLQIVISRCTSSGLGSCCFAIATER